MNILIITPDYPPSFGGIGTHVYEVSNQLTKLGCKITILVIRLARPISQPDEFKIRLFENLTVVTFPSSFDGDFSELVDFDYDKNGTILNLLRNAKMNLEIFPMVYNYLMTCEPFDIIHSHDAYLANISVAIKRIFNLPMVSTIHALTASIQNHLDSNRRFLINNSNTTILVSKQMKDQIKYRFGVIQSKLSIIHNGVSGEFTRQLLHKKNDRKCKEKTITFCGRLAPLKGCDILISAFSRLLVKIDSDFKLKLLIIGDGQSKNGLEALVEKLNIEEYVEFVGYKASNEVREILQKSLLHIVPSLEEPFGIVALEAMAEGAPVIATSVGGLMEFVKDKCNGVLVPPNNVEALANAMYSLLNDEQTALRYMENGIKTAKDYSWENVAKKTLEIYIQAIKHEHIQGENNDKLKRLGAGWYEYPDGSKIFISDKL